MHTVLLILSYKSFQDNVHLYDIHGSWDYNRTRLKKRISHFPHLTVAFSYLAIKGGPEVLIRTFFLIIRVRESDKRWATRTQSLWTRRRPRRILRPKRLLLQSPANTMATPPAIVGKNGEHVKTLFPCFFHFLSNYTKGNPHLRRRPRLVVPHHLLSLLERRGEEGEGGGPLCAGVPPN